MTSPFHSGAAAHEQTRLQGYAARLKSALEMLEQNRVLEARAAFAELTALDASRAAGWIGHALACGACGDASAQHESVDRALSLEPGNLWGLVLKGDALMHTGNVTSASAFYLNAIKLAPPDEHLPPPLRRALQHARDFVDSQSRQVKASLISAFPEDAELPQRFRQSLEVLMGQRQIFHSSPKYFYYPGLPSIEFHDRASFTWLEELECNISRIRQELELVLKNQQSFRPYIESSANAPRKSQDGLLDNDNWSACYLIKNGVQQEIATLCPATLECVRKAPLCDLPGRSPSVLFSLLRPGAHIPPHCGLINSRLIVHLPLIVPSGCEFRVGSTTRTWTEGTAWVFDDSIEHEAWNHSQQTRVILLFEIWRPELTEVERASLRKLFATLDQQRGGPGDWEI